MALELRQQFLSQSRDGREIKIKDATGQEAMGRASGYGSTNGSAQSILAYYFVVSRLFNSVDMMVKVDGTNESLPTPLELAYGATMTITSGLLEDNGGDENLSSLAMRDGVLDVDMYVEFPGLADVQIVKDTNFVTGGVFTDALKGDAIVVNGKIYEIDKSMYDNGDSVLYVTDYFDEDATEFGILYRSNMKILLTAVGDNLHQYATSRIKNDLESYLWDYLSVGSAFKRAAVGYFNAETPNYTEANELLMSRYDLLKRFTI